jgi:hypothetical protein
MFFLFRLVFWLSITFALIEAPKGGFLPSAAGLAEKAQEELTAHCKADPVACIETLRKADEMRRNLEPAPARGRS